MHGMFKTAMPLIQEFEGYRDTGYYATDDEKARYCNSRLWLNS